MKNITKENLIINYEDFIKMYEKENWIKVGRWKVSRLAFDIFNCSQSKYYLKKYNLKNIFPIKYFSIGHEVFVAKKELDLIKSEIMNQLKSNNYSFIYNFEKKQAGFRAELCKQWYN